MAKTSDPNPRDRAWRLFLLAHTLLLERIEAELSARGLPPLAWYDVLWELENAPERRLRMHELADRVVLPRYNLTRLADRLEDAGLISREDCQDDRRGYFLRLTSSGMDVRRKMWKVYGPQIDTLFARHLSNATARSLVDSLARMTRDLRDARPKGAST
jgi:DNA-binding MarR family transcriptional regulator